MNRPAHFIIPPISRAGRCGASLTVGIPRAFCYHDHGKLWEAFFAMLGCNVLVSPLTNRQILDLGVRSVSSETCLPVKVMAGHVLSLAGKTDLIFIPRYISTEHDEFTCPKICSLPDIMRLSLKADFEILEIAIDPHRGPEKTDRSLSAVADRLSLDEGLVRAAFIKAVKNRMHADMEAASDADNPAHEASGPEASGPVIAVLGHPYMLGDPYISMDLIKKLRTRGYAVATPANLEYGIKRQKAYPFTGRIFYNVGLDNLGSAFHYANLKDIKGIIYITPFACGVDSLVTEFIERRLKALKMDTPYMKVTVDEHTGEAGFDTRLEAFLDMIGGRP